MSKEDKNSIAYVGFEEFEPYDPSQPEKELLRAILVTALNDVKKGGEDKRRATEFFLSPEDDYIFSFLAICDYLKIDHKKVLKVTGLDRSSEQSQETRDSFSDEDLDS